MVADAGAARVIAGRYTLRREIGRGGMGTVWLAADGMLHRDVALKEVTFAVHLSDDERRVLYERTLREARAAARFQHPQVTTVHDVVEEDGRPWIVMEHVRSTSLSDAVQQRGRLAPGVVARIGLDVLAALTAAHRAGIVHRDVKPANVLLGDDGRAWLTDFGIATSSGEPGLTSDGLLLGSPSYMSPERARGEEPGPAADLWSLGATLFTAVEGRPAFQRNEAIATLVAVTTEEPTLSPAAGSLAPVLTGLLDKDPARRMTAEQVRAALTAALSAPEADRRAGLSHPAPATPVEGAADQSASDRRAGTARGDLVARFDREELAALLSSTAAVTRAVAESVAREAAHSVGRSVSRKAKRSASHALKPRPVSPPPSTGGTALPERPDRPPDRSRPERNRPRFRFKRRWVAVPVLVLMLLALLVVGAAVVLLSSMLG